MNDFKLSGQTMDKIEQIREKSDHLSENDGPAEVIERVVDAHVIREFGGEIDSYEERVSDRQEELKAMIRGEEQEVEELKESDDSNLTERQRALKRKISSGR